jgi:ABC-type transporter Mla subunit MlaD
VVAVRLDASSHRVLDRISQVTTTLDRTATALDEGVASTERIGSTLDALGPTLQRTTTSLRSGSATLQQLASSADELSFLGSRPFANLGTSLTATATELTGLADSVSADSGLLDGSTASVHRLAAALPPVASSLRTMRTNLEPDVQALLDDVWRLVPLVGAGLAVWLALPGAGAWLLGRRLRSALSV